MEPFQSISVQVCGQLEQVKHRQMHLQQDSQFIIKQQ